MNELTLIKMQELQILFFDTKNQKKYSIYNLLSEHKITHVRVIYMISTDGLHKQQFSDYYFFKLLQTGKIYQL
jgi:hypothetical protein